MITGINESRTLAKHISCKCECNFDTEKRNSNQNGITISVGESVKIRKNIVCTQKSYIWNPATCSCKNSKYVESIVDNSVITCDEIIEEIKPIPANAILTKSTLTKCNSTKIDPTKFYFLPTFLLITIALLIAVNIYFSLIKYGTKQKPLRPCHYITSKLKETRN